MRYHLTLIFCSIAFTLGAFAEVSIRPTKEEICQFKEKIKSDELLIKNFGQLLELLKLDGALYRDYARPLAKAVAWVKDPVQKEKLIHQIINYIESNFEYMDDDDMRLVNPYTFLIDATFIEWGIKPDFDTEFVYSMLKRHYIEAKDAGKVSVDAMDLVRFCSLYPEKIKEVDALFHKYWVGPDEQMFDTVNMIFKKILDGDIYIEAKDSDIQLWRTRSIEDLVDDDTYKGSSERATLIIDNFAFSDLQLLFDKCLGDSFEKRVQILESAAKVLQNKCSPPLDVWIKEFLKQCQKYTDKRPYNIVMLYILLLDTIQHEAKGEYESSLYDDHILQLIFDQTLKSYQLFSVEEKETFSREVRSIFKTPEMDEEELLSFLTSILEMEKDDKIISVHENNWIDIVGASDQIR